MHKKTNFPLISFYLKLFINNFFRMATLMYILLGNCNARRNLKDHPAFRAATRIRIPNIWPVPDPARLTSEYVDPDLGILGVFFDQIYRLSGG